MSCEMTTTAMAIPRCSDTTGKTAFCCDLARNQLNNPIMSRPQPMDTITAVCNGSYITGTANVRATTNFVRNVEMVADQMCSLVESGSAS